MFKKRLITLLFGILLLSACAKESPEMESGATDHDSYIIKAGHAAATTHFAQKSFEKFAEIVETKSGGKIQVEIYPDSELGGERAMLEMLLVGDLTMMAPASAPLDAVTKYMAVWDLPYLFIDHATAHRVLDGEVGQFVLDSMLDKGLVGLTYWENGFRHLTNSVRPVQSVEDMAGLNMRTLENPMQIKAWNLTGANAQPLAFNAVYDALKGKHMDAQETPLSLMYSMQFHDVQNYLSLTGHTYSPWPVVVNKVFYDSLPEALQRVIVDAAIEVRAYNRNLSKEDEEKSLSLLEEEGIEVTEISNEQKQQFKQAMSEIYTDVEQDVGKDFFNKLMAEVEN